MKLLFFVANFPKPGSAVKESVMHILGFFVFFVFLQTTSDASKKLKGKGKKSRASNFPSDRRNVCDTAPPCQLQPAELENKICRLVKKYEMLKNLPVLDVDAIKINHLENAIINLTAIINHHVNQQNMNRIRGMTAEMVELRKELIGKLLELHALNDIEAGQCFIHLYCSNENLALGLAWEFFEIKNPHIILDKTVEIGLKDILERHHHSFDTILNKLCDSEINQDKTDNETNTTAESISDSSRSSTPNKDDSSLQSLTAQIDALDVSEINITNEESKKGDLTLDSSFSFENGHFEDSSSPTREIGLEELTKEGGCSYLSDCEKQLAETLCSLHPTFDEISISDKLENYIGGTRNDKSADMN